MSKSRRNERKGHGIPSNRRHLRGNLTANEVLAEGMGELIGDHGESQQELIQFDIGGKRSDLEFGDSLKDPEIRNWNDDSDRDREEMDNIDLAVETAELEEARSNPTIKDLSEEALKDIFRQGCLVWSGGMRNILTHEVHDDYAPYELINCTFNPGKDVIEKYMWSAPATLCTSEEVQDWAEGYAIGLADIFIEHYNLKYYSAAFVKGYEEGRAQIESLMDAHIASRCC